MKPRTILTIDTEGSVRGIYTEMIDLSMLGRLNVLRLSHIEFSRSKQLWQVRNLQRKVVFSAKTKQACLEWEERRFNR